jgi:dynein heavy chain, axonemal
MISEGKAYMDKRKDREEFRKKLVSLILSKDEELANDDNTFPNAQEREVLRYYNYIKHGIDTIHVAPMDKKVLKRYSQGSKLKPHPFYILSLHRVMGLIPKRLYKWEKTMNTILEEMKEEYVAAVKKAVVDYVLGDVQHRHESKAEITAARKEVQAMSLKYRHRYDENRRLMQRNLFVSNICSAKVLEIWHTVFGDTLLINVNQLAAHENAYDLSEFTSLVQQQIEETKKMLNEKWYTTIQTIFLKGTKRKRIPDATKPRLLKKFYNSVATLMTHQLQDLCIRSLHAYSDFICDIGVTQNK